MQQTIELKTILKAEQITVSHEANFCLKTMALTIRYCTTLKFVRATHHQGDAIYFKSRSIQGSCMSPMSVIWTLLRSPTLWDKFDLDCILGSGNQLFVFLRKFRNLRMEDLS